MYVHQEILFAFPIILFHNLEQLFSLIKHMLSSLLFSEYRKKVLGLLLLNPEASYHLREIARITNISSSGTLHKELLHLANAGILQSKKIGNQLHYSANMQCPIFEELASILRKTSGLADVLASALVKVRQQIHCAFVFGSMARGEAQTYSDVDIMLIGNISFGDAVQALYSSQEILRREINPVVYSTEEFKDRIRKNDSFINEVIAKPKLFIIGSEHELRELTENRAVTDA